MRAAHSCVIVVVATFARHCVAQTTGTCNGICSEDEEMLNASTDVKIGDKYATCGWFDAEAKELNNPGECTSSAEAAATAGCECGIPIECQGICPEGEVMYNADTNVQIGDRSATCDVFDNENKGTMDEKVCAANGEAAVAAGCECGVPIVCPGICSEDEEMLNASTDVKIGDKYATCGWFDAEAKELDNPGDCTNSAEAAATAGCTCGIPIECPGICAEGETLNTLGGEFEVCGQRATCGFYDIQNQDVIDGDICSQNAMNARLAGCNCTGEYPDDDEIDCTGISGAGLASNTVLSILLVGSLLFVSALFE